MDIYLEITNEIQGQLSSTTIEVSKPFLFSATITSTSIDSELNINKELFFDTININSDIPDFLGNVYDLIYSTSTIQSSIAGDINVKYYYAEEKYLKDEVEEIGFNYFDYFQNSITKKWISDLNKHYIKLSAASITLFKLDKAATKQDDLYIQEGGARIYLPSIKLRAIYLTNPFATLLNETYSEEEGNINLSFNLDNMVSTIRSIKNKHISDLYISYRASGIPKIKRVNNNIILLVNNNIVETINLSAYNTTKKVKEAVGNIFGFSVGFNGINDTSSNIINFDETNFYNKVFNLYSKESTFDNISDVIENGDVFITSKNRCYEVLSVKPGGDMGWNYSIYLVQGNLVDISKLSLPGISKRWLNEHQYGIKQKVKME